MTCLGASGLTTAHHTVTQSGCSPDTPTLDCFLLSFAPSSTFRESNTPSTRQITRKPLPHFLCLHAHIHTARGKPLTQSSTPAIFPFCSFVLPHLPLISQHRFLPLWISLFGAQSRNSFRRQGFNTLFDNLFSKSVGHPQAFYPPHIHHSLGQSHL